MKCFPLLAALSVFTPVYGEEPVSRPVNPYRAAPPELPESVIKARILEQAVTKGTSSKSKVTIQRIAPPILPVVPEPVAVPKPVVSPEWLACGFIHTKTGVITVQRSSQGSQLGSGTAPILTGDFVYEHKQFTYKAETDLGGNWQEVASLDLGQKMIARRVGMSGVSTTDFVGFENSNRLRVLPLVTNTTDMRSIVGGTQPIIFAPSAN